MIPTLRHARVWAYPAPCDLRKGFNGLTGLVRQHLCREVLTGDVFLFVNRGGHAAKVLYWDGTGLCVLHKRLQGRFPRLWRRPDSTATGISLTPSELGLFLEGCKLLERHALGAEDLTSRFLGA